MLGARCPESEQKFLLPGIVPTECLVEGNFPFWGQAVLTPKHQQAVLQQRGFDIVDVFAAKLV